jgi:ATP-binding cassette subfamily B protein
MRQSLRRALAAVKLAWAASRASLLAVAAITATQGMVPVALAWITKVLLDELTQPPFSTGTLFACIAALAVLGLAADGLAALEDYLRSGLHRRVRLIVQSRLFARLNRYPSIAVYESPEQLDRVRLAEHAGDHAPEEAVGTGLQLLQAAVTATGFAVTLLVLWAPMAAIVVAIAVPAALLQLRLGRLRATMTQEVTPLQRRQMFFRLLLTDVKAAKEVRLFGLGRFLLGRMLRDLRAANNAEMRVDRFTAWAQLRIGLLTGALTVIGLTATVVLASRGRLSIGEVTVFLAAVAALHATIGSAAAGCARAYEALLLFEHYLAVVNDPVTDAGNLPAPRLSRGIEFHDVWFRYGDGLAWVLRGTNLRLPTQGAIGLVGLNGAGKSTIVKLLTRLYEPTRGRITWDGIDLAQLDPASLRARISAVFQDFMAYDLTAAENIGVGELTKLEDLPRIRAAAALADADTIVARLPQGYQTLLSRIFHGETNASLSGGQWQRIALARAFLREEADLLILDEPSSGLDAVTEHALHQRLAQLRAGRLSLLISHRLNALRDADHILVLEEGLVVEQGDHDRLIRSGGRYAELFSLQAQGYATSVE